MVVGVLLLLCVVWGTNIPPASADSELGDQIAKLRVAPEHIGGYKRSLFPHWDELPNGCSVREEVLRIESRTPPRVNSRTCQVSSGTWFSVYDGVTLHSPSSVDIDHVVALKEAWDSGAWQWTPAKRRAYANDLKDPQSLIAVSSRSNREKADRDPAQWLPVAAARCEYVANWVRVKVRWSLTIDPAEKSTLNRIASTCTTPRTPTPSTSPSSPAESVYYATCAAARAAGAAPLRIGTPGYRAALDRDRDGVACE